ncbi:MAG: hypothetical protein K6G38_05085 [Gammaproteobacteria bacterium]|nr:hypothetical protein [Gammaproteobacteria bacterium]
MISVREVKTKKERREFLNFPLKLYKGCPYYSPNLYISEKDIFKKNYFYYETCEAIYFNAYKDNKIVGRIGGIINRAANEKWNQKRVRFTRLDLIDDIEVARALLKAVEDWAKLKGMNEVFGPMGFSDMEKEGLLVEGFEEPTTFSENYNYEYYKTLLEELGYKKEIDWIAHQIRDSKDLDLDKIKKYVYRSFEKNNLRFCTETNTNKILDKYGKSFFDIVEESYGDLYQTAPFTESQVNEMIKSFRLILDKHYISLIIDENDEVAAFGLAFPFVADILNESGGKLFPWKLPKLIYRMKHSKIMELGLIGVRKKYLKTGLAWAAFISTIERLRSGELEYCETNLTLETNLAIINMFSHFNVRDHRRVRTYIKNVE